MLYLIATPIGHLEDLSYRAVATLKLCDIIYCEDTRHSSILLKRYDIQKKMVPYHKFNEKMSIEPIILDLKQGLNIGLISDAGTPCINDPGQILTQACIEEKIPFTLIPGPCSPIAALVLSGMDSSRFQYIGFIPKGSQKTIRSALNYPGTTIALESPSRIIDTLESFCELDPQRKITISREITKTYEECLRGTAQELLTHFKKTSPKGEMVLTIEGNSPSLEELSLEELIEMLRQFHGLSLKEAIKMAAHLKKTPKREIYKQIHNSDTI